jgi:hypothetical protein
MQRDIRVETEFRARPCRRRYRFCLRAKPVPGWNDVVEGVVLQVDEPRALVHSWTSRMRGAPTFTPVADGAHTRLRLHHEGFDGPGGRTARVPCTAAAGAGSPPAHCPLTSPAPTPGDGVNPIAFTVEPVEVRDAVRLCVPPELTADLGPVRLLPALIIVNGQEVRRDRPTAEDATGGAAAPR